MVVGRILAVVLWSKLVVLASRVVCSRSGIEVVREKSRVLSSTKSSLPMKRRGGSTGQASASPAEQRTGKWSYNQDGSRCKLSWRHCGQQVSILGCLLVILGSLLAQGIFLPGRQWLLVGRYNTGASGAVSCANPTFAPETPIYAWSRNGFLLPRQKQNVKSSGPAP